VSRKPDAAEHVNLEEADPIFIGDLSERHWLENAQIVDEHIDIGQAASQDVAPGGGAEIRGDAINGRVGELASQPVYGIVDSGLRATIDSHPGAFVRQCARSCEPYAGR
jgi:hypothetical protein